MKLQLQKMKPGLELWNEIIIEKVEDPSAYKAWDVVFYVDKGDGQEDRVKQAALDMAKALNGKGHRPYLLFSCEVFAASWPALRRIKLNA